MGESGNTVTIDTRLAVGMPRTERRPGAGLPAGRSPAPTPPEEDGKGSGATEASPECGPAPEEVEQVRRQVLTGRINKCILKIITSINEPPDESLPRK